MKIKIHPKTLDISYIESEYATGFCVGELTLVSGMPPMLSISHPNHKTLTEKSRIKIIFDNEHITCSSHFDRPFDKDLASTLWPDGWHVLIRVIWEIEKYLSQIGVPYEQKVRNIWFPGVREKVEKAGH